MVRMFMCYVQGNQTGLSITLWWLGLPAYRTGDMGPNCAAQTSNSQYAERNPKEAN